MILFPAPSINNKDNNDNGYKKIVSVWFVQIDQIDCKNTVALFEEGLKSTLKKYQKVKYWLFSETFFSDFQTHWKIST